MVGQRHMHWPGAIPPELLIHRVWGRGLSPQQRCGSGLCRWVVVCVCIDTCKSMVHVYGNVCTIHVHVE